MNKKEFYNKEAEFRAKEMLIKVEKAELHVEQKKSELDAHINALRNRYKEYTEALKKLYACTGDEWEAEKEDFEKKYNGDSVVEELNEAAKEFTEKTKKFLTNLGDRVSDFYFKNIDKKK